MTGFVRTTSFYLCFLSVLILTGTVSAQKYKDGFRAIFDGKTLENWEGDPNYWRVENGSLVGEIKPDRLLKANSFIVWKGDKPADFELKAKVRITEKGNSGINYRSDKFADLPHALRGYQADIDGENRYTGQNYEERKRTTLAYRGEVVTIPTVKGLSGELRDHIKDNAWQSRTVTRKLESASSPQARMNPGEWSEIHIVARGNSLKHYVNGQLVSEVLDEDRNNRSDSGLIGVQVHVGPPMKVEFRDIRIKEY